MKSDFAGKCYHLSCPGSAKKMRVKSLTASLQRCVGAIINDPEIDERTKGQMRLHHDALTKLLADIEKDERDAYDHEEAVSVLNPR